MLLVQDIVYEIKAMSNNITGPEQLDLNQDGLVGVEDAWNLLRVRQGAGAREKG